MRILMNPAVHLAEAYRSGELTVQGNLVSAIETIFRRWPAEIPRTTSRSRSTVLRRARRNVRHHYDLSNDFFRLWLDKEMVYTCAYFPDPEMGLEEAQVAKMDYVCRKVGLQPGDRVLEAGCGWGALARHMAVHYGAQVTACNVSHEQIRHARERASELGLADRVSYIEDDFRNISGTYDVFISVGMLEHVGRKNYDDLGRVIHERLDPQRGRGLLHFIGRSRPEPLHAWIRRRIFPEAYPPTLGEVVTRVIEPWGLAVLDVENLRRHYEKTLDHWRQRFEGAAGRVAAMFDEAFVRTWRLYLAGSEASFATGCLQLFQVAFARPQDNDLPWTRSSLYSRALRGES
jgi:cyclopropane-fatty-acyl-phospholipid synthase